MTRRMRPEQLDAAVSIALNGLSMEARSHLDITRLKLAEMLAVYLESQAHRYSDEEIQQIWHSHEVVIHKLHMGTISLYQMWALMDNAKLSVLDALANSLDRLQCTEDEVVITSFALESLLFQFTALLDVYMLYVCQILKVRLDGRITQARFVKALERERCASPEVAGTLKCFMTSVFAPVEPNGAFIDPAWGSILRSLRDKIAHRDLIRPSFESQELLLDQVLLDWPFLRGMSWQAFGQMMQNGAYCLIKDDMAPILYGVKWIPGPYRPGMFSE